MKIGILTFHRAYNYGAVLQCYALQQYLLLQGYDVEVIDYRQPWIDACFKPFSLLMFKHYLHHPKLMYRYLIYFKRRKNILSKRKKYFTAFRDKYLLVSSNPVKAKEGIPYYDAYIIGSDQLWGLLCLGGSFDDVYLGRFPHKSSSKVIGYAISSDIKSIEQLAKDGRIAEVLKCFSAISLREKNIADKVRSITGNEVPITVDPTLLAEEHLWDPLVNENWKKQKYVVIYQVRGISKYKNVLYEKAREIASAIGDDCKIIDLSDMSYSVTDFVSIIKFAKFVVTTSFHATVFSIIFKKPFYAIKLNDGRDNRYVDLCTALGLSNQCIETNERSINQTVDYSHVDERLQMLNQESKIFLNNSLKVCL